MIVGYDPGTISGIAIIDFHGNLIYSSSFRGGIKEAVEIIKQFGKPAIIAGDKPGLEAVKQLATYFGALAVFPKEPLKFEDKKSIGKMYNVHTDHEADALAAALYARKRHMKLIRKILNLETKIFLKLMNKELANMKDALDSLDKKEEEKKIKEPKDYERIIEAQKNRIIKLEKSIEAKNASIEELEKKNKLLSKRIEELEKEKRSTTLDALLNYLDFYKKRNVELERKIEEMEKELEEIKERVKKIGSIKKKEVQLDEKEKILKIIEEYKKRHLNF